MLSIALFYLIAFLMGFALCIMPGPVGIEVLQHTLKRQNSHALSVGLGAGVGDALWALVAFYGITPFLKNGQGNHLEGIFLLVAALVTFVIGIISIKDSRFTLKVGAKTETVAKKVVRKRKRWSFLKGFTLIMVNPLGIGSWMIVLSFLKKTKIYIPLTLTYEIFFFVAVLIGAFGYSIFMITVASRIKPLFEPERTAKIIKFLGYLLVTFSVYFLFHSLRAFFKH